ncbi:MAG: hypothetical protein QOE03_1108 [Micromonosporaceae bacterium]|jgi:hypothetical protein|nr:hypothetical protein [Micromonosporaceae bacterium]
MPLLAVVALLAAGVLAAALSSPGATRVPLPTQRPERPPAAASAAAPSEQPLAAPRPPARSLQLPGWLETVASALCLALVLAVVGMLVWYVVRDRFRVRSAPLAAAGGPFPPLVAGRTEEVVAALDAGLVGLGDADTDPRRAVIACWVRLEAAAASAGTPRQPGDTPTDLVARLLRAHRVSQPVLDEFAALYRQARYATHAVDEPMRAAAVRSLGQLRAELTVGVG